MRRLLPISLLTLIALACDSQATGLPEPSEPAAEVSDGAHFGNSHFYFLPPLFNAPSYSGTFDGSVSPSVSICEWSGASNACGLVVAEFQPGSSPDGFVAKDVTGQKYHVNWKTTSIRMV